MRNILIADRQFVSGLRSNRKAHLISFNAELNSPNGILLRAASIIGSRKCKRIEILAHGTYSDLRYNNPDNLSSRVCVGYGGFAISMGTPKITIDNTHVFSILYDKVKTIVLDCCAIAYTNPIFRGSFGDGQLLCSMISRQTKAVVYAADEVQYGANTSNLNNMHNRWRGNVYRFEPDGSFKNIGRDFSRFIE